MYKRLLSDEHGSMEIEAGGELTAAPGRRRRSTEERRLIVEETLGPGASVARVARRHGVNANQVFGWRKLYESGRLGEPAGGMTLLPVTMVEEQVLPRVMPEPVVAAPSGSIHIEMPGRVLIRMEGSVDAAMIRAVLKGLGA